MAEILTIQDFEGVNRVPQGQYSNLQEYIDTYELVYLQKMLGDELTDLFIADLLNGVPQTDVYENIYSPFSLVLRGCVYRSFGLKEVLKGFINFHYRKDLEQQGTTVGTKIAKSENSENFTRSVKKLTVYNNSVRQYHAIQAYIIEKKSDYEKFKGEELKVTSFI